MSPRWTLTSSCLSDGTELLALKTDGRTLFTYAPGPKPYERIWVVYSNGFPLLELVSREACIRHAGQVACSKLEVVPGGARE